MDHIDLSRYFVEKGYKTGRPRCDEQKLLKMILFAFMENGIRSLREIEKFCRNDIRYIYLLDGMKVPSFATFGNLIRNELTDSMNQEVLGYLGVKLEKREEYAIDYVSELLTMYKEAARLDEASFVSGCGHRKSIQQKQTGKRLP